MKEFQRPLGDVIKKARLEQGLTQSRIAKQLGVDSRTILNIENGKANPKMEVLYPLIRFLKINPQEIFYPDQPTDNAALQKLQLFLGDCSEAEADALLPMCQYFVSALRAKEKQLLENDQ